MLPKRATHLTLKRFFLRIWNDNSNPAWICREDVVVLQFVEKFTSPVISVSFERP